MGMFDTMPGGEETATTTAEPEGQQEAGAEEAQVQVEEQPKHVPIPKPSRRAAAAQERERATNEIAQVRETLTKLEQERAREREELAQLKGYMQAIQPILQQRQQGGQQQEAPRGPTPEQLFAEADRLLDAGDVVAYRAKQAEAVALKAYEAVQTRIPQQQSQPQQQGPQIDPVVMMLGAQHQVYPGTREWQLATIEDQRLALLYNLPAGPERYARAFAAAAATKQSQQAPGYSQQAAGALAAVPTNRASSAPAKSEPGINVKPEMYERMKQNARLAGMSFDEYVKEYAAAHPNEVS